MEASDPLVALFADVEVPLNARRVSVPMPASRRLPTVPRLRWQLPAGVAMAAVAAVSVLVIGQQLPHQGLPSQARAATDLARITTAIRTAAQTRNGAALVHAISEAKAELQHIDLSQVTDASLRAQLSALRQELASLPPSTPGAEEAAGVEALLPEPSANPNPTSDETALPAESPSPAPADSPTPAPSESPSPEPSPTPAPDATPSPTADGAASPVPDATPAAATMAPDATATPAPDPTLYGTATDPSAPF
jgi:hypothetical protein